MSREIEIYFKNQCNVIEEKLHIKGRKYQNLMRNLKQRIGILGKKFKVIDRANEYHENH